MSSSRSNATRSRRRTERDKSALKQLCRVLVRRCREETLLLHAEDEELVRLLRQKAPAWDVRSPANDGLEDGHRYRSVVLFEILHPLSEEERKRTLYRAWSRVEIGGRLYIVSPSTGLSQEGKQPRLRPRALRRMVRKLGRPRFLMEQPYRWILLSVHRVDPSRAGVDRMVRRRLVVTNRLCKGRVLELGCGRGLLPRMVHEGGLPAVGIDLNHAKLRAAREHFPGGHFIRADIRAVPLPERTFDTVLLPEVLEHVPDEAGDRMLAEAWRLLRPGGRLVVSVPNEDCIPHPHHVRTFDRGKLRRILAPFGRPRLVTDQPYKWLMMYVDKASAEAATE